MSRIFTPFGDTTK